MSDLASVRLQQLAYLDAVARLGRFIDAADDMAVTQPALSQGLARLQESVGAALFETVGRRKQLTAMGREVADFAAKVLGEMRRLEASVNARKGGKGGVLEVGMIDAVALYLRAAAIDRYRSRHPATDLRIRVAGSEQLLDLLAGGTIDVAVVVDPATGFAATPLLTEELHVYSARAASVEEVGRWFLYPVGSHTRRRIDDAFEAYGLRPDVEAESGNPSVLAQLARMGTGAAVLPAGIAETGSEPLRRIHESFSSRDLVIATRTATMDTLTAEFVANLSDGSDETSG